MGERCKAIGSGGQRCEGHLADHEHHSDGVFWTDPDGPADHYAAALVALDGQLGPESPDGSVANPVFAACRDMAGALDAMGDYFDDPSPTEVEWSFAERVAVLVGKAHDHDRMLADGDPAYDAAEDAGELYHVEHEGEDRWLKSDTSGVRKSHHDGGVFLSRTNGPGGSSTLVYISDADLDLLAAFRADAGRPRELEHVDRDQPNTFERCEELPTPQVRVEHRGGVRVEHHFMGTSRSRRDSAAGREGASAVDLREPDRRTPPSSVGGAEQRCSSAPELDAGRSGSATSAGQPTVNRYTGYVEIDTLSHRLHHGAPAQAWLRLGNGKVARYVLAEPQADMHEDGEP